MSEVGPTAVDDAFDDRYSRTPRVTLLLFVVIASLHLATGVVDYLAGEVPWWGVVFWPRSTGVLAAFGGRVSVAVEAGQSWRLLSNVFLHGDLLHLSVNLVALWILGRIAETLYGPARYLTLFIGAGIAGSVASQLFGGELATGASGSLFGLMGAAIVFGRRHRAQLPPDLRRYFGRVMIVTAALNLALGFFIPWIDNPGHVGGLIGGMIGGALLEDFVISSSAPKPWTAVVMVALCGVSIAWVVWCVVASVSMNLAALP